MSMFFKKPEKWALLLDFFGFIFFDGKNPTFVVIPQDESESIFHFQIL